MPTPLRVKVQGSQELSGKKLNMAGSEVRQVQAFLDGISIRFRVQGLGFRGLELPVDLPSMPEQAILCHGKADGTGSAGSGTASRSTPSHYLRKSKPPLRLRRESDAQNFKSL